MFSDTPGGSSRKDSQVVPVRFATARGRTWASPQRRVTVHGYSPDLHLPALPRWKKKRHGILQRLPRSWRRKRGSMG